MLDRDAIAAHVAAELQSWQVPAVELVAVKDGAVQLAQAYGTGEVGRDLPVGPTTLFHHGSTGKAFTAALAASLVDDGLLEWDRPIRDSWPDFRLFDDVGTQRVTVADLLSHRSGSARHEWVWLANPSLPRSELVARMRHLPPAGDLRTAMRYCNLGYVAVGQLIGELTGSDWETQLRSRLLDPAGMTHTVTSTAAITATSDYALPHVDRGGEVRSIGFRAMDSVAPAGQVVSCAADMARWLQLQLGAGRVDGRQVVSEATLAATHRAHVPIEAPLLTGIQSVGYALGWAVASWHGRRLLWHNGEVDGFRTEIVLLPEEGIGVAACVNRAGSGLPLALTYHVAELLLGLEPAPWSALVRAEEHAADTDGTTAPSPSVVDAAGPSRDLGEFAGSYDHPGYGRLEVSVDGDGKLAASLGELEMATTHRHYDTWTLGYEPLDASVPLTFVAGADGTVDEAVVPLEDAVPPIRFSRADREERPVNLHDPQRERSPKHWQRRLEELLDEVKAPGAVLALMHGDEVHEYAAGVANLATGTAMTTDTLFPIASISKVFTATLAMQLVDEGKLDLDQPLRDYLPDFRVADEQATATLTARHLLTHTGGIGGDKEDSFGRGDDALGRYVADCATLGQVHPTGATFSYCNSGYNILGHLVSVLRDTTWDQAIREHVFEPIGMARSGTLPEDVIWHRLAAGHQTGDDDQPELLGSWEGERAHGPCGGVVTSAGQLLSFVRMHLAGGVTDDGARVLSTASVAAMVSPQVALPNPYTGETHWGLGWELTRRDQQPPLFGHGGDLLGHHSRLIVCDEPRFAAVLLINGDGADHVGRALFTEALAEVGVVQPEPPSPPAAPPKVDLDAIAGEYETLAVRATLTPAGDHLEATFRIIAERIAQMMPESQHEQHATFVPVTSSLFVTRDDDGDPWTPVVFDDSGSERYLHIGGRAMRRT